MYTFDKTISTVDHCLKFVSEAKGVPADRLVLCLAKSDEVRKILPPGSESLMSDVLEELNGPKFVNCRFVCFELRSSLNPESSSLNDFVPVVFKYEKMLKSINTYINHPVKTGSISLLLLNREEADRDLYKQLLYLFNDMLTERELELLSKYYKENLLPPAKSTATSVNTQSTELGSTQASEKQPKAAQTKIEGNKPAAKTGKKGQYTQDQGINKQKPSQESQKTSTPKQMTPKIEPKLPEEPQSEKMVTKIEELTFQDLLNEVILGSLDAKRAAASPLLENLEEYRKILESQADLKQTVSLRYDNPHKLKCQNCGRPGYHTCNMSSGNGSKVDILFKILRDGKVNESPSSSVTLSVLVNDPVALDMLDKRSISEDGARGLQLKSNIDLNFCLETMQKKEDMGKDCLVDCEKCQKKTEREVCYLVERAPKLLLMQLKRFKTDYNPKTQSIEKRKVCTMVELHESVQIKDQKFDLYGVVNHYGEIDKGHYTACVKKPEDGQWFLYDDEKVSKISFKDVNTEGAYLLFFKLQSA